MLRRIASIFLAFIAAVAFTSCGSTGSSDSKEAASLTVQHTQGTTELKAQPQRIAVLDFGALDTVDALGLGDRVVGLPKKALPSFLKKYADPKYADLGTLQEPNLEALNAANPDLVIVGFRSAAKYPELSKHWPTIDITYPAEQDFLEGTKHSAGIIAKAFNQDAAVATKVQALEAKVEALKPKTSSAGKGLIVMTSAGKVTIHGANSRYGILNTRLGVQPAIADVKADSHGQPASFELIGQANPDVMFVVDRDAAIGQQGANARQVLDNELVRNTNAWKNNKVVMLDGSRWYVAIHGLNNADSMLNEIEKGLA